MVSDGHHVAMSSIVSGLWKEKLVLQTFFFCVRGMWKVFVSKIERGCRMDSKLSKVQTNRAGKFQRKNCSTGLRFCTEFLRGLVASGVFEEGVWCVLACVFWRQVLLQNFWPAVCWEVDLDSLIAENDGSQVLTEQRHWRGFCGICSEVVVNVTDS